MRKKEGHRPGREDAVGEDAGKLTSKRPAGNRERRDERSSTGGVQRGNAGIEPAVNSSSAHANAARSGRARRPVVWAIAFGAIALVAIGFWPDSLPAGAETTKVTDLRALCESWPELFMRGSRNAAGDACPPGHGRREDPRPRSDSLSSP